MRIFIQLLIRFVELVNKPLRAQEGFYTEFWRNVFIYFIFFLYLKCWVNSRAQVQGKKQNKNKRLKVWREIKSAAGENTTHCNKISDEEDEE